jgi:outer membrane lipoprotein SlyB
MKQNWESMDADKRREYQEALQTLESSFNAQKQKIETTSANKEMMVKGGAIVGGIAGAYFGAGNPAAIMAGSMAGGAVGAAAADSGAAG